MLAIEDLRSLGCATGLRVAVASATAALAEVQSSELQLLGREALAQVEDWIASPGPEKVARMRGMQFQLEAHPRVDEILSAFFALFAGTMVPISGQCCIGAATSAEIAARSVGLEAVRSAIVEALEASGPSA